MNLAGVFLLMTLLLIIAILILMLIQQIIDLISMVLLHPFEGMVVIAIVVSLIMLVLRKK